MAVRTLVATVLAGLAVALLVVVGPAASRTLLEQRDGPGPERPRPVVLSEDDGERSDDGPAARPGSGTDADRPRPTVDRPGAGADVDDDVSGPARVILPVPRDWDPDDDRDDDRDDDGDDDGDDG